MAQRFFEKLLIKRAFNFNVFSCIPWQEIVPSTDFPLHYIDVSSETDPEQAAKSWMMDDLARPVDLTRGPLFTEALFKAAQDHYLLWSIDLFCINAVYIFDSRSAINVKLNPSVAIW